MLNRLSHRGAHPVTFALLILQGPVWPLLEGDLRQQREEYSPEGKVCSPQNA